MRNSKIYLVLFAISILTFGCSIPIEEMDVCNSGVEVKNLNEEGEYYVVDTVRHGDIAHIFASYCWSKDSLGGSHSFRWGLYDGDKCLRNGQYTPVEFGTSPFKLSFTLDTSALRKGTYDCVLYVDGKERLRVPLTIE